MLLELWNICRSLKSEATREPIVQPPALEIDGVEIRFVKNRKARRYILRLVSPTVARVTIPRGGSLREGRAFAERHREWIDTQQSRRAVQAAEVDPLSPSEKASLRARAVVELAARTFELARLHGITVNRVTVRNQRTRWGSCSVRGTISLNWRLIQTPELVRDYIIVHELMHRREMNHGKRFWAEVAAAFPRYEEAEGELRKLTINK